MARTKRSQLLSKNASLAQDIARPLAKRCYSSALMIKARTAYGACEYQSTSSFKVSRRELFRRAAVSQPNYTKPISRWQLAVLMAGPQSSESMPVKIEIVE